MKQSSRTRSAPSGTATSDRPGNSGVDCVVRFMVTMSNASPENQQWTERPSASEPPPRDNQSMFRWLFERSTDAIFLFEPRQQVFVDCNQAAVAMMRASSKEQLLMAHPADISPEFQPDGQTSRDKTPRMAEIAL